VPFFGIFANFQSFFRWPLPGKFSTDALAYIVNCSLCICPRKHRFFRNQPKNLIFL